MFYQNNSIIHAKQWIFVCLVRSHASNVNRGKRNINRWDYSNDYRRLSTWAPTKAIGCEEIDKKENKKTRKTLRYIFGSRHCCHHCHHHHRLQSFHSFACDYVRGAITRNPNKHLMRSAFRLFQANIFICKRFPTTQRRWSEKKKPTSLHRLLFFMFLFRFYFLRRFWTVFFYDSKSRCFVLSMVDARGPHSNVHSVRQTDLTIARLSRLLSNEKSEENFISLSHHFVCTIVTLTYRKRWTNKKRREKYREPDSSWIKTKNLKKFAEKKNQSEKQ